MKPGFLIIIYSSILFSFICFPACEKPEQEPTADFSSDKNEGMAPIDIQFFDRSTNNPSKWNWEFGDGNKSAQQNPLHTYIAYGKYTVTLSVSSSTGTDMIKKVAFIDVSKNDNAPEAGFTLEPSQGEAPLSVTFVDESTNNPTSWKWDFGDGTTSNSQNPVHSYVENGFFTVELKVDNSFGSASLTKTNIIKIPAEFVLGTFTDNRDGTTYKTVTMGGQTWFAENLNYETASSWCYDDKPSNCNTHGRLYDWQTALNVCPEGWHLPDDEEWKVLEGAMDTQFGAGSTEWDVSDFRGYDAGKRMKTSSGWFEGGNGSDAFKFEALPSGWRSFYGAYYRLNAFTSYWTSSEKTSNSAMYRRLGYHSDQIGRHDDTKEFGYSVRCIKDD